MPKAKESDTFDDLRLLNLQEVAALVGRSGRTVDGWVRSRRFPAPLQALPGGRKQWRAGTVRRWIEARERKRYRAPERRGRLRQEAAD